MKKRPKRARASEPTFLQYKVVELSTVDESSLEAAVNAWVHHGWALDGVQFAMRESSKRPAMAFVFFTRQASGVEADPARAASRLRALAAPQDEEPR